MVEQIDLGEETGPRTIISGILKFYTPEQLIGKKVLVVCNLPEKKNEGNS